MGAISKMFETDKNVEKQGVILDYGSFRVRIARAGGSNTKYLKILDLVAKPYKRALAQDNLDPKVADKIMREVYAKSVVLAWETGIEEDGKIIRWEPYAEDAEDNKLEFSVDNCLKIFNDFPDLFNDIKAQAEGLALWKKHILEEEAKNLPTSSVTA